MTSVRWGSRPYLDKWWRERICWAGSAQSKVGGFQIVGRADARPALGFVSLQSVRIPVSTIALGERGHKQDSQVTDLILRDFYSKSDNLLLEIHSCLISKKFFSKAGSDPWIHTICKSAENMSAKLLLWEIFGSFETHFSRLKFKYFSTIYNSWQINSWNV